MVVIRLSRGGSKKKPFYFIVVADKHSPRDGKYKEELGFFNPLAAGKAVRLRLERDKIAVWLARGAQLSARVASLVKEWDKTVAPQTAS